MKVTSNILVGKATEAVVAAIQVYNTPNFDYRAESFSILALNGWELLLKAKLLKDNNEEISTLHVMRTEKVDGKNVKKIARSHEGDPITLGFIKVARRLASNKTLPSNVYLNLETLAQLRNKAAHLVDETGRLDVEVHGLASGNVQNFFKVAKDWFQIDIAEKYRLSPMPLGFPRPPQEGTASEDVEEILRFLDGQKAKEVKGDVVHVVVLRSDARPYPDSPTANPVRVVNDPNAPMLQLNDEGFGELFPLSYQNLMDRCRELYADFKANSEFHRRRREILADNPGVAHTRYLDPNKPCGTKKTMYSSDIIKEFDKHYTRK